MANLITEKQKNIINSDYWIRLFSLCLLMLSLFGLFLFAYVVPYYVSVDKKDAKITEQFKSVISIENKENVGESVLRMVSQTVDEMNAVELYNKDTLIPSAYFTKIIENKNFNIQITRLSYNFIEKGQGQFLVSGISKNREGLVAFIEDLKFKAGFASVESPVSSFANDRDISFTINIKTKI